MQLMLVVCYCCTNSNSKLTNTAASVHFIATSVDQYTAVVHIKSFEPSVLSAFRNILVSEPLSVSNSLLYIKVSRDMPDVLTCSNRKGTF